MSGLHVRPSAGNRSRKLAHLRPRIENATGSGETAPGTVPLGAGPVRDEVLAEQVEGRLVSVADDDGRDLIYRWHGLPPAIRGSCLLPSGSSFGLSAPVVGRTRQDVRSSGSAPPGPRAILVAVVAGGRLAMLRRDRSSGPRGKRVEIAVYLRLSTAIRAVISHQWLIGGETRGVVRTDRGNPKVTVCRAFEAMELGGFEPPTSWVRFSRSLLTGTLRFGFGVRKSGPSHQPAANRG
jgi:hypothetical protein